MAEGESQSGSHLGLDQHRIPWSHSGFRSRTDRRFFPLCRLTFWQQNSSCLSVVDKDGGKILKKAVQNQERWT